MDLKEYIDSLTGRPGVYRMLNRDGQVIYVGKAANLRKRVANYFRERQDSAKTRALVSQIASIDVTVTDSVDAALLLESNLIKQLRPRYNVVFRDDKSYPYLYLSGDQDFPRLAFYRGARDSGGTYFGPFPGAGAARRTLHLAQKIFRIRDCAESVFRNRSRPCLQYQIGRCTAPCVGRIDAAQYREDVQHMTLFLQGRTEEAIATLTGPMQRSSDALDYERAAIYRDQIASLRRIQEQNRIAGTGIDCDVIACAGRDGQFCIQVFPIRGGCMLGNRAYFPTQLSDQEPGAIVQSFLAHQYLVDADASRIPGRIHLSHRAPDQDRLESLLSARRGSPVRIGVPARGAAARWVRTAFDNATLAVSQRLEARSARGRKLEALRKALDLDDPPARIECFDVSHTYGEATIASCVVFAHGEPLKSAWRRYNIDGLPGGDDFRAMQDALRRRLARAVRDGGLPDLLLVDGGAPQVQAARQVLREFDLDAMPLVGVAKGPARKPGQETLVLSNAQRRVRLPANSDALRLIQQIRDEAHRFAIQGHRRRRARNRSTSVLERIAGIGPRRRRDLLRHFGGLPGVSRAGVDELAKVRGINKNLARKIYSALHGP